MDAAKRFLAHAAQVVGHCPEQVTTDGHTAYPRAIRETVGEGVEHRSNHYLNNRLEQDHRGNGDQPGIPSFYQKERGGGECYE